MSSIFYGCTNISTPVTAIIGENIRYISEAYYGCSNMTGNFYIYSNNISSISNCFFGRSVNTRLNIFIPKNTVTYDTFSSSKSYLFNSWSSWNNSTDNTYWYNNDFNAYIYPVDDIAATREENGDNKSGLVIGNYPKTEYLTGEEFDPTGMSLFLYRENSSVVKIIDYTYSIDENKVCTISCTYSGVDYSTTMQLYWYTPTLSDFEYIENSDGTYSLTAWKGTLDGVKSTRIIIPKDSNIIL